MISVLRPTSALNAYQPQQRTFCITNPLDTVMNVRFDQVDESYNDTTADTAGIELPRCTLPIAAKDATVEFDVVGPSSTDVYDDDPTIVQTRNANKLCVYVTVTPRATKGDATATFKMTYDYKLVTTPLLRKSDSGSEVSPLPEEHLVTLSLYVRVNFGTVGETKC
jgi:hypothetical protein